MPQRLKLIVAYDGAPFAGWQSQANGNGVQNHLERAFAAVAGTTLRVHGAGRTDAGVHALAQCAHVELGERSLAVAQWPHALNAHLPPTIRVLKCAYVPQVFHARFSAAGKTYRYRIWNDRILPPLELGRWWHVPTTLNAAVLAETAQLFVGRHDYAAYAANRGKPDQSTVRTINSAHVRRRGRGIEIELSGDGFLYKMVRLMVGAIVRCGSSRAATDEVQESLKDPLHCARHRRLVAPAHGLFLVQVWY